MPVALSEPVASWREAPLCIFASKFSVIWSGQSMSVCLGKDGTVKINAK